MNGSRTAPQLIAADRREPRRERATRALVAAYVHEASDRHRSERERTEPAEVNHNLPA
jgi:hypothetical protein